MTVKELLKELQKEKYDVKSVPVFVNIEGERFGIDSCNIFDGEVLLTVGDKKDGFLSEAFKGDYVLEEGE